MEKNSFRGLPMAIEYELKFRATDAAQAAILAQVPGADQHFSMQTTYYDTPSGALSARRYTLRLRLENDTAVCTLKAPEKGAGRGEWETQCSRIEDAIPELCKLGAPADLPDLTAEGLVAVCGARFHRIARTVILEECTVELAIDKGVLTGGGRQIPLCEVEVELKSGSREACDRYAQALAEQFSLQPEPKSKFRRALDLSKGV